MKTVQKTVTLPAESSALADGISATVLAIVAARKANPGAAVEITQDVMAGIQNMSTAIAGLGDLSGEVSADLGGMGEAFAIAGFELERKLAGTEPAAS